MTGIEARQKRSRGAFATALLLSAALGLAGARAGADPLNGSLDLGLSVSKAYEARSVFSNPASLGYQTELNGWNVAASSVYGSSRLGPDEFSLGLTAGWFGFGAEDLADPRGGRSTRYHLAVGLPLVDAALPIFFGGRLGFVRSDTGGSYTSVDAGMQLRPSKLFSFGFVANGINEPAAFGTRLPTQFIGGLTVRPLEGIDVSFDADTSSDAFGKRWGYQATVSAEPLSGVRVRVGYHRELKWLLGAQVNFGTASLFASFQPAPGSPRPFIAGIQLTSTPFRRSLQPNTALRITIDGTVDEEGRRGNLFTNGRPSLLGILRQLDEVTRRDAVREVIVKLERFPLGLEAAAELHEALWRVRQSGRTVEVFLGEAGAREYLIAAAANRIHLEAAGELRFLGFRSERYFFKGTLDKLGIEGEFLAKGEHKSAPEAYTRKESSPVARADTLDRLRKAEAAYLALLKRSRGIGPDEWKKMLDHAIYASDEALEWKLIDSVTGLGDAMEKRKRRHVRENLASLSERLQLPPRVAVIVAEGSILHRRVRLLSLAGEDQVTPEKLEKLFRAALGDARTKAIVLRISSPGGEVLASHQIASLVERAKKDKPVIVSMGDVAASGGYYIAAPADRIFAGPLTVTGSIGVFLGKPNLAGLFKKIDLNKEILTLGPYPGIDSIDRPWTKEERAIMQRRLDNYYRAFTHYVATRRKLSDADVEASAQGAVWLGDDALTRHLTDESGGVLDAVRFAAGKAGLGENDYETSLLTTSPGLFDLFGDDGLLARSTEDSLAALPLGLLGSGALRDLAWMTSLRENPFLYLAPMAFQD